MKDIRWNLADFNYWNFMETHTKECNATACVEVLEYCLSSIRELHHRYTTLTYQYSPGMFVNDFFFKIQEITYSSAHLSLGIIMTESDDAVKWG